MAHLSNLHNRHSGKIYVDARISPENDENAFKYVNPNFNADSLDENTDCFEEGLEQIEQRWFKKNSNATKAKAMYRDDSQASGQTSNHEDSYEEVMEKMEVMMVAESKRLQREEARKNNIPLLDLADSEEEEKEEPEETFPYDSLEVQPYHVQHGSRSNSEGCTPPSIANNHMQGVNFIHNMSPAGDFVNQMGYCQVKTDLQCAKTQCTLSNQNSNAMIQTPNRPYVNGSKEKAKFSDYKAEPISHFSNDSNNNLNLSNCNPKALPNVHKTSHPESQNSPYYQENSQMSRARGNYPYHNQEAHNTEETKTHKNIDPKHSVRKRFIYSKNKTPKSYTAMLSEKLDKGDQENSTGNRPSREKTGVKLAGCQCSNNNCSNRNTYAESISMPCNNHPRDFYKQNQGYWNEQPIPVSGQVKERINSHRNPIPWEKSPKLEQTLVSNFGALSKVMNNNCSNKDTYAESISMPCHDHPRDFYKKNQGYWNEQPIPVPGQVKEKINSHRNPIPWEKSPKVAQTWVSNFGVLSKVTKQNRGFDQKNSRHNNQIAKGNLPPTHPDHMVKTISAPLLTKRRPPHRIKPIDASLKVMSVSAPLNRRAKALPDLWLSNCHDSKALSNDPALTKRLAQSDRVDFITADYLEEFVLKANSTNLPNTNAHGGVILDSLGMSPVRGDVKNNGNVLGSESPTDIHSPHGQTEPPLPLTSERKSRSLAGDYRQYTLEEYKKLKREMQLGINKGSLGPDMQSEEFKGKREKLEKQKRYGSQILERNKKQIESTKQRSRQNSARDVPQTKLDPLPDKRKLAIQYAKTVPKPKAAAAKVFDKPKESIQDDHENSDSYLFHNNDQITKEEFLLGDLDNIRWLKERHDQERQKIAKLLPRKP